MKKLMIFAAVTIIAVSCGGNNKKKQQATTGSLTEATAKSVETYRLNDLLANAENLIDQKVTVIGHVTHTCKHSGKRCFIVGDDQKTSFRVEAKGNIGGFNRELTGSELAITGILKERRLSQEYLDQMEKDANERKATASGEDGSVESCEAEIANIEEMKAWMKENGKDYYSVYYMDGEDYAIVEE